MTTLVHFPEINLAVNLLPETPLSFLMEEFPDGVPVSPMLISIDGLDCFEFDPKKLTDYSVCKQIAAAIVSESYPEQLVYGLFRYNTVMIPVEWIEVIN